MTGNMFNFTKEMGEILVAFRKKARLFQSEVACRIGLAGKSKGYISSLEEVQIKNPCLRTIRLYLTRIIHTLIPLGQRQESSPHRDE
jgi:transcriptional regulator with XRE-family HTH domain